MSILVNNKTKVLIQGITGKYAQIYTSNMLQYRTNVIAGINPNKKEDQINFDGKNIPIYQNCRQAIKKHGKFDLSIIIVPAAYVFNATIDAIRNKIKYLVIISENVNIVETIALINLAKKHNVKIIGPNCAGLLSITQSSCGIIPTNLCKKQGPVGIISRSGSMLYNTIYQLKDIGISTAISIGGDRSCGTSYDFLIKKFNKDSETKCIAIIGEIGTNYEGKLTKIKSKKIFYYIAGANNFSFKTNVSFGHAGAIIGNENETALAKINTLKKNKNIQCYTNYQTFIDEIIKFNKS